jgi:hypothetical protein
MACATPVIGGEPVCGNGRAPLSPALVMDGLSPRQLASKQYEIFRRLMQNDEIIGQVACLKEAVPSRSSGMRQADA